MKEVNSQGSIDLFCSWRIMVHADNTRVTQRFSEKIRLLILMLHREIQEKRTRTTRSLEGRFLPASIKGEDRQMLQEHNAMDNKKDIRFLQASDAKLCV